MSAQETAATINAVVDALSGPSQTVIAEYTHYTFSASVAYIALGGALLWLARKVWGHEDAEEGMAILAAAIAVAGLIFIACNLGDLVAPKGAAIHQFIRDLRAA